MHPHHHNPVDVSPRLAYNVGYGPASTLASTPGSSGAPHMLERLSQADRVSGIGAIAALLSTFLPWYRFDTASSRVSQNAFGTGFLGDILFFAAAGTLLLLLIRHEVIVLRNGLPFREGQAFFVLGCIGLAAV